MEFAIPDFTSPVVSQTNYYNIGIQSHDDQANARIAGSYSNPGANSTVEKINFTPTKNLIVSSWWLAIRSGTPTYSILED